MTGLRYYLFKAVPPHLKSAVSVGIGLFLTIIAFKIGEVRVHCLLPPVPVFVV